MAKRDPEKTARNRIISDLSNQLDDLLPEVLAKTGFQNVHSLNAKIGSKFNEYIDIKNEVITSPEHFISLWLQGYEETPWYDREEPKRLRLHSAGLTIPYLGPTGSSGLLP